jgi:Pyruvate/2-oxoacid:ferredoxin oxidoreductase delta subunit/flavodoxin
MSNVDIYCFSGTGNTLLVCQRMKKVFDAKGSKTRLLRIENEDPKNIVPENIIGLAFPVAIFSTYPIVVRFIKGMPKVEGTKVFMIDTMGGLSLGLVSHVKTLLKRKGYDTIGAKEFVMPDNFMPSLNKDSNNPTIMEKTFLKAEAFAEGLWNGKTSWPCVPVLPGFLFCFSQLIFKIPSFRKKSVKIDKNKCVKCGLCAKLCPLKDIVMREYPVFLDKCELCMRCIAFCPASALYRKKQGEHRYRAVNNADFA